VITPINIALLGVVLAAVALVILRRRRSGAPDQVISDEMPDQTMATADEPPAAIHDDVFSKHVWAESAATMAPVREDAADAVAVIDADIDDDGPEAEVEAEVEVETEVEPEPVVEPDDADDPLAPGAEHDQDTGEIQGLELEAMTDPDDGLGDIITDPGWYLPGETDMTRGSPSGPSGSLIPQNDLAMSGGLPADEAELVAGASPDALPDDSVNDFSATTGWAAPAEAAPEAAEPTWLGLADEEGAAAVAAEDEISFEVAPSPSYDLFELPPLDEGIPEDGPELGAPSLALDRWQDPVTPSPSLVIGSTPVDLTVAQHGPLTVSIDPAAILAIETEEIKRSTSHGDGAVSWELTLKVELRQRGNGNGNGNGKPGAD
jgi:hypothetical protein